ncbi:putative ATP-dependent RNA helicase DHR1 [Apophysomyces ossiformis]|uniref:RNA helicase n=1 Tax=Apophysomyces ossiformis TaxID=679940 RepID=A0A8H7BNZ8_9FUNG|nr:putative ATP-dependent RNA helicase DHR1 [Apophysomyces ossiformis]
MGKSRPRYNEKARASSKRPNQKPHPRARDGGIKTISDTATETENVQVSEQADSNQLMIVPGKKKSKEETKPQPTKVMSRKKKKKMEKYIMRKKKKKKRINPADDALQEYKLKKEARADLIEQASKSTWSSELLKSSKLMGRRTQTLREQLRQAVLEQKAGLDTSDTTVPLFVEKEIDPDMERMFAEPTLMEGPTAGEEPNSAEPTSTGSSVEAVVVGSALKKTDDGPAMPLVKRKRKKKQSTIPAAVRKRYKQRKGMESDTSFDSSDSAYDDDSEDENTEDRKHQSLVEEPVIDGPTALEQVVEAAKEVTVPVQRREAEVDEIAVKLLKDQAEGDLSADSAKPFYVPVNRSKDVQEARLQLPVCGEEQVIMEAIRNNTVVIICGETGSGKTTQVPQFLYEAGWSHPESDNPGLIGVTQPRRVATVSMAKRVGYELNLSEKEVSYQIRYDATVSESTRIKFMTDGVLLRELSEDLLLTKYSVLIIDEAHERNLNTDILIGVVSRVLKLRAELSREDRKKIKPLRVVIMSATLRVSDFTMNTALFDKPPPVINVNARQYPVSIHFNKVTPVDHLAEALKKVSKIHERLPTGGILVFLTGQNEITHLCKLLRKKYPALPPKASHRLQSQEKKANALELKNENIPSGKADVEEEDVDLTRNNIDEEDFALDSDSENDSDDELGFSDEDLEETKDAPLHVLPLYSMLPTEAQLRVFQPPPEGTRLCIVATNVAETSVTIPGIRYVVDCGKVKERRYDVTTGVQSFEIDWTSKAAADQRAGRAGRTGPGHCYRLYSSAVFDQKFPQFSTPEINRMPIEGVVLNMKSMNIHNVINFPFPTPPPKENLTKAEKLLGYLGAISTNNKQITDFGRTMSLFPISPRFAKMLIISQQHGCLPYTIILVSALSVGDPFIQDYHLDEKRPDEEADDSDDDDDLSDEKEKRKFVRKKYYECQMRHAGLDPSSDILKLVNVVGAYEYAGATREYCDENFLRPKAMEEIRNLRRQLTNMVATNFPGVDICVDPKLKPPSARQLKVLRQIITAGLIDSVAVRTDVLETGGGKGKRFKNSRGVPYKLMWSDEEVFIHPTSVLYGQEPPRFLVYTELFQSTRTWLKGVTAVESKWLANIGKELCSFGRPLEYPLPKFLNEKKDRKLVYVVPSFGPKSWPLPPIQNTIERTSFHFFLALLFTNMSDKNLSATYKCVLRSNMLRIIHRQITFSIRYRQLKLTKHNQSGLALFQLQNLPVPASPYMLPQPASSAKASQPSHADDFLSALFSGHPEAKNLHLENSLVLAHPHTIPNNENANPYTAKTFDVQDHRKQSMSKEYSAPETSLAPKYRRGPTPDSSYKGTRRDGPISRPSRPSTPPRGDDNNNNALKMSSSSLPELPNKSTKNIRRPETATDQRQRKDVHWKDLPLDSRMFIRRLPAHAKKYDLQHYFEKYGKVLEVSLKGNYGFVQFDNSDSCASAVRSEKGRSFKGFTLDLEVCRTKPFSSREEESRNYRSADSKDQKEDIRDRRRDHSRSSRHDRNDRSDHHDRNDQFPEHQREMVIVRRRLQEQPAHEEGYDSETAPQRYSDAHPYLDDRRPPSEGWEQDNAHYFATQPGYPYHAYQRDWYADRPGQGPLTDNGEYHAATNYTLDYDPFADEARRYDSPKSEDYRPPIEQRLGSRRPYYTERAGIRKGDLHNESTSARNGRRSPRDGRELSPRRVSKRDYSPKRTSTASPPVPAERSGIRISTLERSRPSYAREGSSTEEKELGLPRRYGKDVPIVQLIVWDEIDRGFVRFIEDSFEAQRIPIQTLFLLYGRVSRDIVVKRMITEGVKALLMVERGSDTQRKVYLQVFERSEEPGSSNIRFDEYEGISVEDAVIIVQRANYDFAPPRPMMLTQSYPHGNRPATAVSAMPPPPPNPLLYNLPISPVASIAPPYGQSLPPSMHPNSAPTTANVDVNVLATLLSIAQNAALSTNISPAQSANAPSAVPPAANPAIQQLLAAIISGNHSSSNSALAATLAAQHPQLTGLNPNTLNGLSGLNAQLLAQSLAAASASSVNAPQQQKATHDLTKSDAAPHQQDLSQSVTDFLGKLLSSQSQGASNARDQGHQNQ